VSSSFREQLERMFVYFWCHLIEHEMDAQLLSSFSFFFLSSTFVCMMRLNVREHRQPAELRLEKSTAERKTSPEFRGEEETNDLFSILFLCLWMTERSEEKICRKQTRFFVLYKRAAAPHFCTIKENKRRR